MPIYEFKCQNCGTRFEKLCNINSAASGINCPNCGASEVRRLISAFYSHGSSSPSSSGSSSCACCQKSSCAGCK
ncbi:MAG: zinc ribbon domain-containing protein [Armatimonadetes bacterium]|nr:zinc ribbon domain-containing protein [Armatimonadota bacterium]